MSEALNFRFVLLGLLYIAAVVFSAVHRTREATVQDEQGARLHLVVGRGHEYSLRGTRDGEYELAQTRPLCVSPEP